jgi:hypothetical protein
VDTDQLEPGEAGVLTELRRGLAACLAALGSNDATACRLFLSRHFPGRGAVDLNADELTLAINIAGDWPASADKYPAPEPEDF